MKLNYTVFGEKPISIVVEMGLGSCISEWIPLAKKLQEYGSVLLYERAGINHSEASAMERTPANIAKELFELLGKLKHVEQLIILAHSQGGLYAAMFCRLYPDMVKNLILLDPLSPRDNEFRDKLNSKEYRKSGVDKSQNVRIMKKLAQCKMGFLTKKILKNAPPFYYYDRYTKEEKDDILGVANNVGHMTTVLNEYVMSHNEEFLQEFGDKEHFPNIPLILVTHSSELAIQESMKFGNNTREFAEKVETMWQDIMKEYLSYSDKTKWIQAGNSVHFIHLQEPELLVGLIKELSIWR